MCLQPALASVIARTAFTKALWGVGASLPIKSTMRRLLAQQLNGPRFISSLTGGTCVPRAQGLLSVSKPADLG